MLVQSKEKPSNMTKEEVVMTRLNNSDASKKVFKPVNAFLVVVHGLIFLFSSMVHPPFSTTRTLPKVMNF